MKIVEVVGISSMGDIYEDRGRTQRPPAVTAGGEVAPAMPPSVASAAAALPLAELEPTPLRRASCRANAPSFRAAVTRGGTIVPEEFWRRAHRFNLRGGASRTSSLSNWSTGRTLRMTLLACVSIASGKWSDQRSMCAATVSKRVLISERSLRRARLATPCTKPRPGLLPRLQARPVRLGTFRFQVSISESTMDRRLDRIALESTKSLLVSKPSQS